MILHKEKHSSSSYLCLLGVIIFDLESKRIAVIKTFPRKKMCAFSLSHELLAATWRHSFKILSPATDFHDFAFLLEGIGTVELCSCTCTWCRRPCVGRNWGYPAPDTPGCSLLQQDYSWAPLPRCWCLWENTLKRWQNTAQERKEWGKPLWETALHSPSVVKKREKVLQTLGLRFSCSLGGSC